MKQSEIGCYMLRSEFLKCVFAVYGEQSTDYLLALRDALTLIVERRHDPANSKPLNQYVGYVKYV